MGGWFLIIDFMGGGTAEAVAVVRVDAGAFRLDALGSIARLDAYGSPARIDDNLGSPARIGQ